MHYMTHRSYRMQKQKFDITYPSALFIKTALDPPEHDKYCVDVSQPGRNRMHYVTRRSNRLQKHKFGVTCPDMHFIETTSGPLEHEK
jgi:hypothetical protein